MSAELDAALEAVEQHDGSPVHVDLEELAALRRLLAASAMLDFSSTIH